MSERKAWTPEEDKALRQLYETRGIKKWAEISRLLQKEYHIFKRNGKQCRQRYHNHLDGSIRHEKWTSEEEEQLLELHNTLGNHWAEISRLLKGRSENCVKNQFYSILRRGLRKINKVIRQRLKRFKELQISILYKIVENCESSEDNEHQVSGRQLKRELAYFGMADIDTRDIDLCRIKTIIEQVKSFDRLHQKKKNQRLEKKREEKDSDDIQSEEYRDDCPALELNLKRNSLYSFRLQNDNLPEIDLECQRLPSLTLPFPSIIRSFSMQSVESLSPRLDRNMSRNYDLFSTQGNFQLFGEFSRGSPQQCSTCDSPYFDQFRSHESNWQMYEQH